ncbi:hypothetical protein P3T73_07460 [Kiritimatiellota bacterium B12222]|nr:hypothetical protein P3T73_07460 [Kiritimatiellota bacterium B12222]
MSDFWVNVAGWIPAITLPAATSLQLIKLLRSRSTQGVSVLTWVLFGIANLGIYIFTEKYFVIQSLMAQLLTAILNFIIVGVILFLKQKEQHD